MTEIVVSFGLLMLISVTDLRMMSLYLQAEKMNYYKTYTLVQALQHPVCAVGLP